MWWPAEFERRTVGCDMPLGAGVESVAHTVPDHPELPRPGSGETRATSGGAARSHLSQPVRRGRTANANGPASGQRTYEPVTAAHAAYGCEPVHPLTSSRSRQAVAGSLR
ncbi:hypothetical protein ACE14D_02435 [Streptomyces sp. Act-28]